MITSHYVALFNTEIGRCGLVWGTDGIAGVQLPESTEVATRERILRRFPGAVEAPPHSDVQSSQGAIVELLSGQQNDLAAIRLDMSGVPSFHRRVYAAARRIPPGTTMTYGQIAKQIGAAGAARAVGQALAKNPFAIVVPCHRVVAAGGRTGGFSGCGGVETKLKLLAIEGLHSDTEPDLFGGVSAHRSDVAAGTEHLRRNDPVMARLIDMIGGFHLPQKPAANTFTALAEAIVHQQLSTKAAATIFARVCAIFQHAQPRLAAERILQDSDETLRAAGLSAPKRRALRDLAQRTIAGEIPTLAKLHTMEDEDIIDCLTKVHGIGRWTAEMLLIFRLGRPDVLPVDDYALRKGFAIAFRKRTMPAPNELRKRAMKWAPYRTMASWYLWRLAELKG